MPLIRMTYAWPEQLAPIPDEETGRLLVSRVPKHPTRPARPWEHAASWWEPIRPAEAREARARGAEVRG